MPAYGLLLVGPAGTGKSQIAYAVARILKLPWTTLDMSSINDPEQLTGSSRIYANAKPGIIMEAFSMAGESNLVFIINELDKAASGKGNGNPADVLLTLLGQPRVYRQLYGMYDSDRRGISDRDGKRQRADQRAAHVTVCGDRHPGLHAGGKKDHLFQIRIAKGIKAHRIKAG